MGAGKIIVSAAIVFLIAVLCLPPRAAAHGVHAGYERKEGIEVFAFYDSGKPFAGARVIVYAPRDPAMPWLLGVCDDRGRFAFVPDSTMPGIWTVQMRQAGHGAMVHISLGESEPPVPLSSRPFSSSQLVVMIFSVVWGSIGTALYFSRRGRRG